MEKRIVQSLLLASAGMFAGAVGLAAFARPAADPLITIAGRGSAGLAVVALSMFIAFKIAEHQQAR